MRLQKRVPFVALASCDISLRYALQRRAPLTFATIAIRSDCARSCYWRLSYCDGREKPVCVARQILIRPTPYRWIVEVISRRLCANSPKRSLVKLCLGLRYELSFNKILWIFCRDDSRTRRKRHLYQKCIDLTWLFLPHCSSDEERDANNWVIAVKSRIVSKKLSCIFSSAN